MSDIPSSIHKKRALVIGNQTYPVCRLKNTKKDATDMKNALELCGFDVDFGIDCTYGKMIELKDRFLENTDEHDLALFYYAGHGCQYDAKNYLIPIDVEEKLRSPCNADDYCVEVEKFLRYFGKRVSYLTIFILDCCRSNILNSGQRALNQSAKGMCQMKATGSTLIVFSCASDTVADDSKYDVENGLFTKHLLDQLKGQKKEINLMLTATANRVKQSSQGRQCPTWVSSITVEEGIYLNETVNLSHRLLDIPSNAKWSPHERIVMSSLSRYPYGLTVDRQSGVVFVADYCDNCIVLVKPDEQKSYSVLRNVNEPTSVLFDKSNNSIIVAECRTRRVVRLSLESNDPQPQTIIEDVSCWGLTMDHKGALYVVDTRNDEVRRFDEGNKRGVVVAGGNGKGSGLHQLSCPFYVAVDSKGSVYVSDCGNNRVVKWNYQAKEGTVVAGFEGNGSERTQLNYPQSIIIDANDNLYVADSHNHRIVRYRKNVKIADLIIDSNSLKGPIAIDFDSQKNIYVSDRSGTVRRFSIAV